MTTRDLETETTDPWIPVFDEVDVAMKEQRKLRRPARDESPRAVEVPWAEPVDARQQALDMFRDLMKDAAKEAMAVAKPAASKPFGVIWEWWKPLHLPGIKSRESFEGRVRLHLLPAIGNLDSETLIAPVLEELWLKLDKSAGLGGHLGLQTLNHLRNHGRRVIRSAMDAGLWPESVENPFSKLKKRKVRRKSKPMITIEEAADFIALAGPVFQNIFATTLYLAPRKSELRKLEVTDVDLVKRRIRIYSSKVDEERYMPIPDELIPYLSDAIAKTKGKYVFPRKDGIRMRRPDEHWETAVRACLGRAGIVTGWRHKCRRNALRNGVRCEGYVEEAADNTPRRCPKCRVRLWAIPIPRKLTFHGLRRISCTLHQQSGCHPLIAQLLLGHEMEKLTTTQSVYTQFDEATMRRELNKLSLKRKTPPPAPPVPDESDVDESCAEDGGSTLAPDSVGLRSRRPVVRIHYRANESVDLPPLLTVSEVAKYLRVSKPTVFRFIETGKLPHLRIGSQIRISNDAFSAYLESVGRGET